MTTPSQSTVAQLHARRRQLLGQIEDLDQIRRGSITEQFVEAVRKDGRRVRRGPYTLYSFKTKGGRSVSRRLHDPRQIAHYRSQIEAFRQFQQCTAELLALGESLSDRAIQEPEALKKTPRTRPRARRRSRG
jgi:transposase